MKISGTYSIKAPSDQLWHALTEPESLAKCMPGCDRLQKTGENEYEASLTVGVGPVKGTYTAKITLTDLVPPESFKMVVDGTGTSGFVHGEGQVTISEKDGKTTVSIDGDAQVGGAVAMVGQRLMGTVNKSMMDRFFRCMGRAARYQFLDRTHSKLRKHLSTHTLTFFQAKLRGLMGTARWPDHNSGTRRLGK